jgi:hypothetical protein
VVFKVINLKPANLAIDGSDYTISSSYRGVDLAKLVIQVHAVDATWRVVTNRAPARDRFVES